MAKKRMFRLDVLETDAFMDMPLTTQALYFHLNLRADDDGFVGNPRRIAHNIGASIDDLNLLIAKRFVLTFEDGVIVIKHWRLHNNLTANRYQETKFIEDKAFLKIKDNGAYSFDHGEIIDDAHYIEVGKRETRQRRDKDETKTNSDKNSIDKNSIDKYTSAFNEFWKNYPRKKDKGQAYKCFKARLNDGYSEEELLTACINYAAECEHNKTEERYIKHGATFLSVNEPFLDYLKGEKSGDNTEEQRNKEIDEVIRRIESGEAEHDDDGLWD